MVNIPREEYLDSGILMPDNSVYWRSKKRFWRDFYQNFYSELTWPKQQEVQVTSLGINEVTVWMW